MPHVCQLGNCRAQNSTECCLHFTDSSVCVPKIMSPSSVFPRSRDSCKHLGVFGRPMKSGRPCGDTWGSSPWAFLGGMVEPLCKKLLGLGQISQGVPRLCVCLLRNPFLEHHPKGALT